MSYLKRRRKYYLFYGFFFLAFHIYFLLLVRNMYLGYLWYFDILMLIALSVFFTIDLCSFLRLEKEKKQLLERGSLLCQEIKSDFENRDIAKHDVAVINERLQNAFDENCELQDFVAKWCHEFKIPLSTGLLITEKMKEEGCRSELKEQLEKMNQQLNAMLLGCKLQSSLFDLQIKRVSLLECVQSSIHNHQFFLIRKHFSVDMQVENVFVYTDFSWLVYILDQLINNAVKYAGKDPLLHIRTEEEQNAKKLFLEDNGEGIKSEELRRIFEKGFTGSNYHNGKYKSTGMGLYMVSKIAARLGHDITAESEYGRYTRFCITFSS